MESKNDYLDIGNMQYLLANLTQLTLEVTDACNLKCKYCGSGDLYNDYDKRDNRIINIKAAINIIDYLVEFWNSSYNTFANKNVFISFYGGEPLLSMTFIRKIVSYIKNIECKYRTFKFSMTTNAILLDRYMDFLVENQFELLISLDGNEYNTSYRVDKRGKPAFKKIIKNVDCLFKKYPDYFNEKVNFNAVLHNRNSVEEIVMYIKNKYNKIPSIGELNNIGVDYVLNGRPNTEIKKIGIVNLVMS